MALTKIKDVIQDIDFKKAPIGSSPYLEIGDVDIHTKKYELKSKVSVSGAVFCPKNVVIVSKVRPNRGAVSLTQSEIVVSSAFTFLKVDTSKCLPEYLFYYLAWNPDFFIYLSSKATGATYPTVKEIEILNYPINKLPSLKEQERIVALIKEAEDLKDKRTEANQKMEDLISALFVKMFGDPFLNKNKLPTCKLNTILNIIGGGTPSKSNNSFWGGNVPWVSPKDMKSNYINDSQDHITEEAIKKSATNLIPINSILVVTRSGILQHTLPLAIITRTLTINQDIKALVNLNELKANSLFIFSQLQFREKEILKMVKTGVTVQSLNTEDLKNLNLILPSIELQNKFAELVKEIEIQKEKQAQITHMVDELFNAVMAKSFA